MNLTQNAREALKATKDNWLRSLLTISLIAIGISALVGILTAIDGIEQNIISGLSGLGANSFDVKDIDNSRRRRRHGVVQKIARPLKYNEVSEFKKRFESTKGDKVTVTTTVSYGTEIKYHSQKTNPNSAVIGIDENYLDIKSNAIKEGRSFNENDIQRASQFVIIGQEIANTLFKKSKAIGKRILMNGYSFTVIGVLEKKGGLSSSQSDDRTALIPLPMANIMGNKRELTYTITVGVENPAAMESTMGEATGLMRIIRKDRLKDDKPSFEVSTSESLSSTMSSITPKLRIGGFAISFLTLLGASIGLMNIMLVSVTERTREIGLRKALGAAPRHIRSQFIIEAIVICQIGGLLGILFGIGIGNAVSMIIGEGEQSYIIPWLWISIGVIVCIVVGLAAGAYPAYKASALDPIESLRHS